MPTGIQLTPFLQICILHSCLVEILLCCKITAFYRESTDILAPERNTRDTEVQTSSDLSFHIFPTSTDIATPSSSRITLQTWEATTSEQEYTTILWRELIAITILIPICHARFSSTLAVINSLCIDNRISIEILVRRT